MIKDWLPTQLQFIRDHLQVDMAGQEIATIFNVNVAEVWQAAKAMKLARTPRGTLTALHTPFAPVVGMGIRKATLRDAEPPQSMAEFRADYPDGQRHMDFRK